MESTIFIEAHFSGSRYNGHSIPFEVLKDLSTLETIIKEAAKILFLKKNPKRKRVPNGFNNFELRLSSIGSGSTRATICYDELEKKPDSKDLYLTKPLPGLVSDARKQFCNTIQQVSADTFGTDNVLPIDVLYHFEQLGRSLGLNDTVTFQTPSSNGNSPILTKAITDKLVSKSKRIQSTETVSLSGAVSEADQYKRCFEVHLVDGRRVKAPITNRSQLNVVIEAFAGYKDNIHVRIEGIGSFTKNKELIKIDTIEDIVILNSLDISHRISELRQLDVGWYNGEGLAPQPAGLDWLENELNKLKLDTEYLPRIYPTLEGNVQLEWSILDIELSFEIDLDTKIGYLHRHSLTTQTYEEHDVYIKDLKDWNILVNMLTTIQ